MQQERFGPHSPTLEYSFLSQIMSYCHGFHLANRFCMTKYDYEVLLVAANLARYTRGQLGIICSQWDNFLGGHHFFGLSSNVLFEFNKIKINLDGKRQECHGI
jgi:hypothetical protein